ncbi:MAG TPA: GDSL-type esterase/lipase family protein [Pirellulales bacterium]|jgi:peptidoglycan/LPS O-acetylase OafA/YrhL|nr:GDSL-type esterase/lipase family protein [Pirellulales bacterium]
MPNAAHRIRGLDSIRFVCALWVLMRHVRPPALPEIFTNPTVHTLQRGVMGNLFNGQAAVIVFFVISGFCIHFPYRLATQPPAYVNFLARRYTRIGLPLVAALAINLCWLPNNQSFDLWAVGGTIVWSLLAEIIYYTLYPAIFIAARRLGWPRLIASAYVLSIGVILTAPGSMYFSSYGPWLTWIVGLPSWLLGCYLAERVAADAARVVTRPRIWLWRGAIWCASVAASALMFHSPLGFPWTLSVFGFACFFWLRNEIAWFQSHAPPQALEWAGRWSYSLYIMHLLLFDLFEPWQLSAWPQPLGWLAEICAILLGSYVFFLLVEQPAHWLARRKRAPATGAVVGQSKLMAYSVLPLVVVSLVCGVSYVVWKKDWLVKYVLPRPALAAASIPADLDLQAGERMVFLGDSLTSAGVEPGGYVSLIDASLSLYRTELGVRIFGAGVGGNRVADLQARLDKVFALEPTLVCILIGINDVWQPPRTPLAQFEATLTEIVASLQHRGARVLLCTPPTIGEQPGGLNPLDGALDACAGAVRRVAGARQTMLCDLRRAFVAHQNGADDDGTPARLTTDGVHLNRAGNRLVAEQVLGALSVNSTARAFPRGP